MRIEFPVRRLAALVSIALVAGCSASSPPSPAMALPPAAQGPPPGWAIQSSANVMADGVTVSRPDFSPVGWYPAEVPSTVVGTLVDDGLFGDPFLGMSFRNIPGTSYPIGGSFAYAEMPADSPWLPPWWYRSPLFVDASAAGRRVWLHLGGVSYRGALFVNGTEVADENTIVGTFRKFEFDVTDLVSPGGENAMAVLVTAPTMESLAMSWVDWGPAPADKDMGLWRPVTLTITGPVRLRDPFVHVALAVPSLASAEFVVSVEIENSLATPVTADLEGTIETMTISQTVMLGAHEKRVVTFEPITLPAPRVWWPRPLGAQELYQLNVKASVNGEASDLATQQFGIRDVQSELTPQGFRRFLVNGRPILIRGGGFSPDLFLRVNTVRLEDEVKYAADLGLNALRLEGKVGAEELYNLADQYGLFLLSGWCCCEQWEWWGQWTPEDYAVAPLSLADQIKQLRNHPSALAWLTGSDIAPPPDVQQQYVDVLTQQGWESPMIAGASDQNAPPLGDTGMKMPGPYMWVPPNYWALDQSNGGAFGFNTETSPGAAIPPLESLVKFIPADHLWPVDDVWTFHAGGVTFMALDGYVSALAARYGASDGVADFARTSQLAAYEGERALFEAYGKSKYTSTGVIQWMLNNPWPGVIWHLFDWYLKPGGGYFGARKANESLHVQWGYDDGVVNVVSSLPIASTGLSVTARVLDLHANVLTNQTAKLDVPADGVVPALTIASPSQVPGNVYFVDLALTDSLGASVSRNLYWLSTTPDVLDEADSTWYVTPTSQYADLTGLRSLAPAMITASATVAADVVAGEEDEVATVMLTNSGAALAFFVRAEIAAGSGDEVVPIRWDDNYVTLLPGETRTLHARYRVADRNGAAATLRMEGWNVAQASTPIP